MFVFTSIHVLTHKKWGYDLCIFHELNAHAKTQNVFLFLITLPYRNNGVVVSEFGR